MLTALNFTYHITATTYTYLPITLLCVRAHIDKQTRLNHLFYYNILYILKFLTGTIQRFKYFSLNIVQKSQS